MRLPDYLIIGTMKGGTTILHDFICDHPNVVAAKQKEVHYFSLFYDRGESWYSDYFRDADSSVITGEASPTYFDMDAGGVIPRIIFRDIPKVKLILVVRDPVERAISHYNHYCVVNKLEYLQKMGPERFFNLPFSDALRCTTVEQTHLFHALSFSCYSNRYNQYKSIFGKNLLVVTNQSLRKNPHAVMAQVQSHIGLEAVDSVRFEDVKYSAGTSTEQISAETLRKLQAFLYPDYERFCESAGIEFTAV
ncbi:hypothetical protein AB833_05825 [Chromatiales bacterium (ex Bugula neritina AB1)]|nr:hypothetical protein AB833_05825 [Chromatiales bacterium (ex Bugula neritina AB1)]